MVKGHPMRKFLMSLLTALLFLQIPAQAQAQDTQDNEKLVQIRLLAERAKVSGGDEIWIGIEQSIEHHWHTYWFNPGDSGTITRADWQLPTDSSISDIYWPTPKKLPYGPLMNYGYEDNVVLLQKLKLPASLPEGPITLTADIELLVCKEECIPEYGTYSLTLNGDESQSEDNAAFFENAISKLPVQTDWTSTFTQDDKNFRLEVTLPQEVANEIKIETLTFYPYEWGLIQNPKPQSALIDGNTLSFAQAVGERDYKELENAPFLVTYKDNENRQKSFEINAKPLAQTATANTPSAASPEAQAITIPDITVTQAILYALIGGMILNLMPCVFPVLSIKALSLVKTADKHPNLARKHGIAYTLGVVLSFLAVAAGLMALKATGEQIGWGFHLQNPIIVGGLAYLLFIIGLNLMGYFEFGGNLGNVGNKLTQGEGLKSSFFTGVLATLVATPCTAPFMAGAIGFALTQSTFIGLAIFAALGFGLALPYLALSFIPALQHILPKPGAWMNTFKQALAFPMFMAAAWLVWVFSEQTGSSGVLQILMGISFIGFGIWLTQTSKKPITKALTIIAFILAAMMLITPMSHTQNASGSTSGEHKFGEVFTTEKLEQILAEKDQPVFVEMTAAWCITCKVNHAAAINIPSTKKAFADSNVQYLIGDWTNQDPEITKYLDSFGRNGVPIYVFYDERNPETGKRPEPQVLPQILTPGSIPNLFKNR
jgi:thiol:disulfide interchange protein DsbD